MKITINHDEMLRIEALLPESAKALITVLGYATTIKLINRFGGTTLSQKSGMAQERTGGVHRLLREVLNDEESKKLIAYLGSDQFYIPRCDVALRELRNARFVADVAKCQTEGLSIRQAMGVLCPTYGISDRQGWKLINDRMRKPEPQQRKLF